MPNDRESNEIDERELIDAIKDAFVVNEEEAQELVERFRETVRKMKQNVPEA